MNDNFQFRYTMTGMLPGKVRWELVSGSYVEHVFLTHYTAARGLVSPTRYQVYVDRKPVGILHKTLKAAKQELERTIYPMPK